MNKKNKNVPSVPESVLEKISLLLSEERYFSSNEKINQGERRLQYLLLKKIEEELDISVLPVEFEEDESDWMQCFNSLGKSLDLFQYEDIDWELCFATLDKILGEECVEFDELEELLSSDFHSLEELLIETKWKPMIQKILEESCLDHFIEKGAFQLLYDLWSYLDSSYNIIAGGISSSYIPCFLDWLEQEECPFPETYRKRLENLAKLIASSEIIIGKSHVTITRNAWEFLFYINLMDEMEGEQWKKELNVVFMFSLNIFTKIISWTEKNVPSFKKQCETFTSESLGKIFYV